MILKTKLSLGIGFLFVIIFALAGVCSYYVQKLSQESDNILKDNYNSLVYAKNMFTALNDMNIAITGILFNPNQTDNPADYHIKNFAAARTEFEKNLKEEKGNITEIHEQDYVNQLNTTYNLYVNLCMQIKKGSGKAAIYFNELLPAYEKARQLVNNINDVNMQAIVRKNQSAQQASAGIINSMAIMVTICIILAFGYFWYFPFYVSNSISYLSDKMKQLLKDAGITLDIKSDDETHIILQSINLLENKFNLKENNKIKM